MCLKMLCKCKCDCISIYTTHGIHTATSVLERRTKGGSCSERLIFVCVCCCGIECDEWHWKLCNFISYRIVKLTSAPHSSSLILHLFFGKFTRKTGNYKIKINTITMRTQSIMCIFHLISETKSKTRQNNTKMKNGLSMLSIKFPPHLKSTVKLKIDAMWEFINNCRLFSACSICWKMCKCCRFHTQTAKFPSIFAQKKSSSQNKFEQI